MTVTIVDGTAARVGLPRVPRITVGLPPVGTGSGRDAGLWVGDGPPTVVPGSRLQDEYLDKASGDVYTLGGSMAAPVWTITANIKGPAGDTTLDEVERQRLLDDLAAQADDDYPIDLVALLENALAG